jgi:hypothetical protein
MFSPFASGIYEGILKDQLLVKYNIQADFESFKVKALSRIDATGVVLNKENSRIKAGEAIIKIESLRPFADYYSLRLETNKVEIAEVDKKEFPIFNIISKTTDEDVLKSAKMDYINFNLIKNKELIKVYNIEAVGEKLKVYGNIDIKQNKSICSFKIYVPAEKTEDMPEFSKSLSKLLFNMEEEEGWSVFEINNVPCSF